MIRNFTGFAFRLAATALAMATFILALVAAASAAGPWEGRWNTDFGELRLLQGDDRVYGDYDTTGMIEARVSPDGRTLRGAFNRHDGDWGLFQFELTKDGRAWTGRWGWNDDTTLRQGDWNARLTSSRRPRLTQAVDAPVYWPIPMYEAPTAAFETFIDHAGMSGAGPVDSQLVGMWNLIGSGRQHGTLDIRRSSRSLGEVHGTLGVWLSMGGNVAHEGEIGTLRFTRDELVVFIRSSEFDGEYRLAIRLAGLASGRMEATLAGEGFSDPVTLERVGGAATPLDDLAADEPYEDDLPGVGVSGPAYRLIGVPAGKRLAARSAGNRDAASVGSIPGDATDILVLGCEPYMEAYRYEELTDAGKRRVLDASWCEISHDDITGFVPGRYLEAIGS
ncbi:hypothetical protein EJC49_14270 [Aquibium carbonis]|uniref:SH3 domain-containing protein n=1 Tax=Aquibium carbonis TaxID=2495581 RepID=A0A3R9YRY4_9HYPH|nr:hypothetical protein [Aquibium carbonis]RST85701.1 hypothetical protein EJC49_14270 [Aquibium carbonis]